MLNRIRPLSLGTEGPAEALCVTTKTKEGRGAGEGEALSSLALHLREAKLISLAGKGRGARSGGGERAGFPAETRDAAELWTAPRERDSGRLQGPCDRSPLLPRTPTTDPSTIPV